MNDEKLKNELQAAFDAAERKPPSFAATWAGAESRYAGARRRNRLLAGVAAAVAVLAVTFLLLPAQQTGVSDEYLIADALMNATSWSAPSDALLPQRQFDIYQEIPSLNESTISREGTLL